MFHNKEMQKLFSVFLFLSIISSTLGFCIHFLAGILVIFTTAALHPFQISMDLHNITVKQNIGN